LADWNKPPSSTTGGHGVLPAATGASRPPAIHLPLHRNHDNPSMYLHMDEETGMIAASQERERTKQAALAHQRDALIWRELEHPATSSDPPSRSR
jgi:hypothetical protein